MTRPRHRTTPTGTRPDVPSSAPPPSPTFDAESRPIGREAAFHLSVDRLLAEMAEARADGRARPVPEPEPIRLITTTVPVAGMTCRSCEHRIARHVGRIPGVERVTASAVHGRVEIQSARRIAPAAIARAIQAAGYEIGRTPWITADPNVWLTALAGAGLIGALLFLASATGLADLAAGAGDLSQGGIVVALLLGLAAGVSTCAALVGGLVLALTAAFEAGREAGGVDDRATAARMRPALVFIGGRIAGYGVFGAVLGALGASVALPPQVTAILMLVVAVVMTILGTRLTGLSPRIATWSPTLPMGVSRRLGLTDGPGGGYSDRRAAVLGAASFFLPCGFTQAVQIYALSTGSPLFGGAVLAVFALGTAPGLLALGGLPVVVPPTWRPTLLRVVGVVVIGFAVVNGSAGLRLSGISLPFGISAVSAAVAPSGTAGSGSQALQTTQNAGGYSPQNVSIYAGTPTKWTITSTSTSSCAASIVVPDLGIQVRLHRGANTIDLPALNPGVLRYSCAMGMFEGAITVVPKPAAPASGSAGASQNP